jgi:predicted enzyme related to lactoylglutathione lyase
MQNTVVWFDIPVLNLDRAIKFYSAVIGVAVTRQEFGQMAIGVFPHEGNSVGGCLVKDEAQKPSEHGPLIYINAQGRLDQAVTAVSSNGGKVLQAKHPIGPHGFRAIVLDSEGNRIALHSM